ncbi:MAG TPA: CcmD family protein [Chthonomonadales bacterium]|nr:CcmD family protein [Chthonomonadales bacterium]
MISLVVVPLIVWVGLFVYLVALDRRVARALAMSRREDDL